MGSIAFTRNYSDHSNDTGYQFEFHCDKCGNGYRSTFRASQPRLSDYATSPNVSVGSSATPPRTINDS